MDNRVAGRKISALRQARGLTQQQLAAMMNVSHQAVSKWESGLALPDISTMLELTRFFGITVEQLFEDENAEYAEAAGANADIETEIPQIETKEVRNMNIQQFLQMAPFMSKAAVEEIAMGIDVGITAAQFAKLAPFISPEALSALVSKHRPQLSWDTLKKLAPFMERDAVDALARAVAAGEETIQPDSDSRSKAFNDLSRAFDSFGKDFGQAFDDLGRKAKKGVKKAIRFGSKVVNEVSSAINDFSEDAKAEKPAAERSEKAVAIRKKAFERAVKDGRWDWIAQHMEEIHADNELKGKIAAQAKEQGMHQWICENLGGYADETTVKAAVASGNWDWLGENVWFFEPAMQQKVALAAMKAENWPWLSGYAGQIEIRECALEIAQAALKAGEKALAAQLAESYLNPSEAAVLAREACAAGDYETLELLLPLAGKEYLAHLLEEFAEQENWDTVLRFAANADTEMIEKLMETAVEQGNFDAIDSLDAYLG